MTWAFVQSFSQNAQYNATGGNATAVTLGSAVAVGDTILVGTTVGAQTSTLAPTMTDQLSNTYTKLTAAQGGQLFDSTNVASTDAWICIVTHAGTPTITYKPNGATSQQFIGIKGSHFTGSDSASTRRASAGQVQTNPGSTANAISAVAAGGTIASQSGDLVWGFCGSPGPGTTGVYSAGTGFTKSATDTTDQLFDEWLLGASGAHAVTATNSTGTAEVDLTIGIAITPASGAATTTAPMPPVPYALNIALNPLARARRTYAAYSSDTLSTASPVNITTDVGTLTLTGFSPTVDVSNNQNVTPGVGALTLTGFAPTISVSNNQAVTPGAGVLTLTGFAPVVTVGIRVTPGVGALTLTGFAPTVSITNNQSVTPGAGALTLTGFAPTVTVSNNQNVTPGAGVLTLTGFAPTVLIGTRVAPGVGALTLTGFAPTVTVSQNQTVTPGTGVLTLTGFAPTVFVSNPQNIRPGVGVLTLTGFAPTITVVIANLPPMYPPGKFAPDALIVASFAANGIVATFAPDSITAAAAPDANLTPGYSPNDPTATFTPNLTS